MYTRAAGHQGQVTDLYLRIDQSVWFNTCLSRTQWTNMATLPLIVTAGSGPTLLGRDWLTIVPVMKKDGRVRICGDYKVTVNRAAKLDKYPIPRIDELFASLAGGKTFSKFITRIPTDTLRETVTTLCCDKHAQGSV